MRSGEVMGNENIDTPTQELSRACTHGRMLHTYTYVYIRISPECVSEWVI